MVTENLNTKKLFARLDEIADELIELISSAEEDVFDAIPFENSWTVAELASHVTKSNKAIAQGLEMQGRPADRKVDERVAELKKTFLNYNIKFQSPEFIRPTQNIYPKEEVVEKFKNSIERIKELRSKINLSEVITLPVFGEVTKLELLHFVLYHTQRHVHQLKKILVVIDIKNKI